MGERYRSGNARVLDRLYMVRDSLPPIHSLQSDKKITQSAQMIATAITVNSDGAIILSDGAVFGILLAILFAHGIVCSAATKILARLNIYYVIVNGGFGHREFNGFFVLMVVVLYV